MALRVIAFLCLLPACGRPAVALLPDRASFAGQLAVTTPRGDRIAGLVAFDRARGILQFSWQRDAGHACSMWRRDTEVMVFVDEQFRAADAAEASVFAWVEQAIAPGPVRRVGDDAYVRAVAGGDLRVEVRAAAAAHGRNG